MLARIFVFSLCIYIAIVRSESNDLGKVVFTTILFRHGDRTPIEPYPNDPYKNNSLWPAPWGELTDIGKRGHYELGKWLRARYSDLLPKLYNREDIHIQSTDVDRTLMSAYSNLAGLYEPSKNSSWNPNILWTPIPVHTIPEKLDSVLAGKAPCPKYNKEIENIENLDIFKKINENNSLLYEYLSSSSGLNVTSVQEVSQLYDVLLIDEIYNFTLPEWSKTVYPQPMANLSALSFTIPCFTKTAARLKVGPLFNQILSHMQAKIDGTLTQKAWMYSAHDTTVANVLQALNVFEPHCPPYLSLILLELRQKKEGYYVTMYYKNSSSLPPKLLPILGCEELCKFDKFINLFSSLIPANWKKECFETGNFDQISTQIYYKNSTNVLPYLLKIPNCEKICPFQEFRALISRLIPRNWEKECHENTIAGHMDDAATFIAILASLVFACLFFLYFLVVLKSCKNQRQNQSEFAYTVLKMNVT